MRLDEILSSKETKIIPARNNYGLMNILKAYEFQVNGSRYLCYLDSCAGEDKPNTFGFMKIEGDRGSHRVTGDNIPFRVLSSVMRCLQLIIQKVKPTSVYLKGFSTKQHHLYVKMIKHFHSMIPAPYVVTFGDEGEVLISRAA